MSQPRQIAAYVHDPREAQQIIDTMAGTAERLARLADQGQETRTADYAANRVDLVGELTRTREAHADALERLGLRPVYTYNERAELAAVSVATPANPQVAVMVPGAPLADRWDNIADGRTIPAGAEATAQRAVEASGYVEGLVSTVPAQTDQAPTYVPEAQRVAELPPPPPAQPLQAVR